MRALDEILEQEDVRRFILQCRESPAVQGLLVEIDPRWMEAWRIGERLNPDNPPNGYDSLGGFTMWPPSAGLDWTPYHQITIKDLDWRPKYWEIIAGPLSSRRWPVVMHVCLYSKLSPQTPEVPSFGGQSIQVRYQARPVSRLHVGAKSKHRPLIGGIGIGVSSGAVGTLGGILKGIGGRYYGVSCGHVIGDASEVVQPAARDGKASEVIGTILARHVPPAYPSYLPKSEEVQKEYASQLDVALVELDAKSFGVTLEILKIGKVVGTISSADIQQGQRLEFTGRTSGWKRVTKGFRSPYYNLFDENSGSYYCYEDSMVVRDPSGGIPTTGGDSGAWVCAEDGAERRWAGIVVGGDEQLGFALPADRIMQWCGALSPPLKLYFSEHELKEKTIQALRDRLTEADQSRADHVHPEKWSRFSPCPVCGGPGSEEMGSP